MAKIRDYFVIFNNCRRGQKKHIQDFVDKKGKVKNSVISEEPYPERPDDLDVHYHVCMSFVSPLSYNKMIDDCQRLNNTLKTPRPETWPDEKQWGHCLVRPLKDTDWDETSGILKYLTNPDKDKIVDPDLIITKNVVYGRGNIECLHCHCLFDSVLPGAYDRMDKKGLCYKCRFRLETFGGPNEVGYPENVSMNIGLYLDRFDNYFRCTDMWEAYKMA